MRDNLLHKVRGIDVTDGNCLIEEADFSSNMLISISHVAPWRHLRRYCNDYCMLLLSQWQLLTPDLTSATTACAVCRASRRWSISRRFEIATLAHRCHPHPALPTATLFTTRTLVFFPYTAHCLLSLTSHVLCPLTFAVMLALLTSAVCRAQHALQDQRGCRARRPQTSLFALQCIPPQPRYLPPGGTPQLS